jgi:hypothetical protein
MKSKATPKTKGSSVLRATRWTAIARAARSQQAKPAFPLMQAMLVDSGDLPGPQAAAQAELAKATKPAKAAPKTKRDPSPELKQAAEAPKLSTIGTLARAMDDALIMGGAWTDLAKAVGKPISQFRSHARWRTRVGSPWRLEETDDRVKMVAAK